MHANWTRGPVRFPPALTRAFPPLHAQKLDAPRGRAWEGWRTCVCSWASCSSSAFLLPSVSGTVIPPLIPAALVVLVASLTAALPIAMVDLAQVSRRPRQRAAHLSPLAPPAPAHPRPRPRVLSTSRQPHPRISPRAALHRTLLLPLRCASTASAPLPARHPRIRRPRLHTLEWEGRRRGGRAGVRVRARRLQMGTDVSPHRRGRCVWRWWGRPRRGGRGDGCGWSRSDQRFGRRTRWASGCCERGGEGRGGCHRRRKAVDEIGRVRVRRVRRETCRVCGWARRGGRRARQRRGGSREDAREELETAQDGSCGIAGQGDGDSGPPIGSSAPPVFVMHRASTRLTGGGRRSARKWGCRRPGKGWRRGWRTCGGGGRWRLRLMQRKVVERGGGVRCITGPGNVVDLTCRRTDVGSICATADTRSCQAPARAEDARWTYLSRLPPPRRTRRTNFKTLGVYYRLPSYSH
ncbi:hypothetical protein B0H16DRAFT_410399 [Mycena metata]|uniref:Uncharacterized protein n=1 Tax=Mycena metata TaxID=1033252 RepID=A0AAD7MIH6_9AGAR|nr:hypothetical protein B0H16DRAFT_410399 [Mycena metata]